MSGKPFISLAVVGSKGCGKTTALAQLCQQLGGFEEDAHAECRDLAREMGYPSCQHGWMLDRLTSERTRGATIESSLASFDSASYRYMAVDTPGDPQFSRNMLSAACMADIAVLVVSAAAGEFEEGAQSGRTREIALSCFTMGIKNIVVWVTKLDDPSVRYSTSRFEEIKKAVNTFLREVGYKQKDAPFVPISGLAGENLTTASGETSSIPSPAAIEVLDSLGPINRPAEKPLRLPVLKVHDMANVGTVIVGKVESGNVKPGMKVLFSSTGRVAEVQSVHVGGQKVGQATGGDIASVCIGRVEGVRRGMVMSSASDDPATDVESFLAQVIVLDHPGVIRRGYCPSVTVHTAQVPCEFEELLAKVDRKTGKEVETNPDTAKTNEVISVRLRPRGPVCLEVFSAYPPLGRFAVRDHGRTVAVGVVKEVTKRPVPKPRGDNQGDD
mmetsp:Transcript_13593/g.29935  ORF Transcript_13593/g.29935 Transcript_13593/m.29935 type:complete len:442 (-) Transcript_13593:84-1409(-)